MTPTQGITDVVRGEDLADNTPRQILLQRALGLPTPALPAHAAGAGRLTGEKLSKQNGAQPLDLAEPLAALNAAAAVLGLPRHTGSVCSGRLAAWSRQWPFLQSPGD